MGDAAKALRDAAQALSAISDTARLDAELLLAHALKIDRTKLLLALPELDVPAGFDALVERRMTCEPVAHILGEKEFWGLSFKVSPDVLIPRPDSELLIEEAVNRFEGCAPENILDLGSGSGALLLAALSEFPGATGVGLDSSQAALDMAAGNATNLNLESRATFLQVDWRKPGWHAELGGPFDLILANPPYVSTKAQLSSEVANFEPSSALFAGEDGLDDYEILIPALEKLLHSDGTALFEIGFDQAKSVSKIARNHGYVVDCKKDLGGNDRLLILRR